MQEQKMQEQKINELSMAEAGALIQFLDRVQVTGIKEATVYLQLVNKLEAILTDGGEN